MIRVRGAALAPVVALFALAAVAPLFFSANSDVLNNMVLAAVYVVMALGLNIIVGFAGLLDLGYVAFFAIGAYTAAYFGSGFWDTRPRARHLHPGRRLRGRHARIHLNFVLILALAVVTTAIAGALIGVPTLRLRGDYIAIVTLAFGEIIGQIVSNGRQIEVFGGTLTSGPIGIGPIDRIELPLIGRFGALDLRPWYWVALALVALALVVNVNLRDSRLGRAWLAMRDDESAAACAGIPIARTKLLAYGTGAAFGGISGAFFASLSGRGERGPVRVLLLDLHPRDGRAGRPRIDRGRRGRRDPPLGGQQLPAARRPVRPSEQGRPGVRPVGDQLRHLRRDPRGGDASPTAGPRAGSLPDAA